MISLKQINGRNYWLGKLLIGSIEPKASPWLDLLGCEEVVFTVEMDSAEGDEVEFWGSNLVDMPSALSGFRMAKSVTRAGEFRFKGYRWYRAVHAKASGLPVTVHLIGRG